MNSVKSRKKNFSDRDCYELVRAVQKYAHIIECKTPGKYKNSDKTATWGTIARQFNKHSSVVSKKKTFEIHFLSSVLTRFVIIFQYRDAAALRMRWKSDKSNVRDYIQYLKTSQSRSGRDPKQIPKPRLINVIAKMIGIECSALEPAPDELEPAPVGS